MVEGVIVILVLVIIVAVGYNAIEDYHKKDKYKISFRESMDLTELPVITFVNNNVKLNFLLDTGSNTCYINESVLNSYNLEYKLSNSETPMIGVEGNRVFVKNCQMTISYKDLHFDSVFNINNMDAAFENIKKESGVQIHGILGSLFFQKYKYVLDFDSLIAYLK